MKSMSSVDIRACISELRSLIGGRIDKIYHYPPDEIRIKLRAEGRKDLIIEAGKRIHLTKFPKESPKLPSSFAMLMRKHLEGGRIASITQHDFDRIVLMEIEARGSKYFIIAELFSKGNVILADEEMKVIMPLKFMFRPGQQYRFPEPRLTPFEIDENVLKDILDSREVVRTLATKGGLGGLYAEEVLLRAGIDKNRKGEELTPEEIARIVNAIREVFSKVEKNEFSPYIVMEGEKYFDVLPLELKRYSEYEKKYFETFNEALDEFYSRMIVEEVEKQEKKSEVLEKLEKRLQEQLETKKRFEEELEKYRRIAELIYENYQMVDSILQAFIKARQTKSWDEIKEILKEEHKKGRLTMVEGVVPEKNSILLNIGGHSLTLRLDMSIHENAEFYYDQSKKIASKLEGLMKAIEKTKAEMEKAEEIESRKMFQSIRAVRKREWYEKFRWFITSDGFLVIGGRNAEMNEEIVSKYMEGKDLFFHTQSPGAPATILKNGQEAPQTSIEEAAIFASTYSALWKEGKYSGEVYYVLPEQVKRAARHGEYLARGSFYIEGKRNYLTVSLSCAVGVEISKLRVLGGPKKAVEKYCDYFVEIEPGNLSANEISREIAKTLVEKAPRDEAHIVRSIATPDEIMKFLPPGKHRLK
jgi:predicted ribosome quality control (RQC) complex YloA/Tae2 family protein